MGPALTSMTRLAPGAQQSGYYPLARIGGVDHFVDLEVGRGAERLAAGIGRRHHLVEQRAALAGIGGGSSMFANSREEWERTFNICWFGVYYCTRAFLPMLQKADKGHIINTSSVNGFWAQIGAHLPQTAYSAAKFAVKGFSEALQTDLRINAPHIKCSVVMPGHIGTGIAGNTAKVQSGNDSDTFTPGQLRVVRARIAASGIDTSKMSDADVEKVARERIRKFLEEAPMTAAQAATVILDGVKADRWRILVGEDAKKIDERVRQMPEQAYDVDFFQKFAAEVGWKVAR